MAPAGFGPATHALKVRCSTSWATEPFYKILIQFSLYFVIIKFSLGIVLATTPVCRKSKKANAWDYSYTPSSGLRVLILFINTAIPFLLWRKWQDSNQSGRLDSRFENTILIDEKELKLIFKMISKPLASHQFVSPATALSVIIILLKCFVFMSHQGTCPGQVAPQGLPKRHPACCFHNKTFKVLGVVSTLN